MAKLLIVDDSQTIRVILKKALETAAFEVVEAVDGLDALGKLENSGPFDLLISDINMPNMDGISLFQKMKENGGYRNMPVVVLSTEVGSEMKAKGKELGVKAWVGKPPNTTKLIEAVKQILAMK